MLNNIIKFSLNNRLIVLFASVLLLIAGGIVAPKMEVDVFPDITAPTVVVMTEAHGMAPEEIERLVTFQVETAVNGSANVRRVRSASAMGFSIVWVEFNWGTDIYIARQIVSEKLTTLSEKLPEGVGSPTIAPQASIMGEIMIIGLTADTTNLMELRSIADWEIRPRLLSLGGVAQVTNIGGDYKQYQIHADPLKLKFYKISFTELIDACSDVNNNSSGGFVEQHGSNYIIRGVGRTTDLEEIGSTVVKVVDAIPVKISDVAKVQIGAAPKMGAGFLKTQKSVLITVSKQPKINTLELTADIEEELEKIEEGFSDDIKIHSNIFKQADFIQTAVDNVQRAIIEGGIFVVIILIFFLLDFRTTIISLLAIPLSLIVSILVLQWLGFSINTMSLGGMAIAIGSLVDDAIIDVDNVLKHLRANALKSSKNRLPILKVVYDGSVEIRSSIMNATLIIIVAFVPLFFLSGMEGRLLKPLGISYIVALTASLLVALSVTPVLCSYLLSNPKRLIKFRKGSKMVRRLNSFYFHSLKRTLNNKRLLLYVVSFFAVATLVSTIWLGRSFLPDFNEGSLVITTTTHPGISLSESNKLGIEIEKALLAVPEISLTARKTGRAELDEHALSVNASEIECPFDLKERSRDEFMADVRERLSKINGVNFTIGQPIGHRIDHMLSGTKANIALKIFGSNLAKMFNIANEIGETIEVIPGVVDVNVEQQIEIPQLQIIPRRELLAKYGITIATFNRFVDFALAGEKVSDVFEENRSYDLILRFDEKYRNTIEAISNAYIDTDEGKKIPLSFVADVVSSSGPNTINRENIQRKLVVSANVSGRDIRSVVNDIRKEIKANVEFPDGYRIEYGGQFESAEEASRILLLASLGAVFVIFLLLYQEFKNIKLAVIILVNLPLALIGGVISIWFTSAIVSIPSIIGFITLFGIATRNGILLVSRYIDLYSQGFTHQSVILKGSLDRLSPILMTALTAALALIPLAMSGSTPGNEIQSPMAIVILGGLISSTFLNIYIIPTIFSFINPSVLLKKTELR